MAVIEWVGISGDWGQSPGSANNNWTPAVTPNSADDVIVNQDAGADPELPGVISNVMYAGQTNSIDFTGFTGQLTTSSAVNASLVVFNGDITLSSAMTIDPKVYIETTFASVCNITSNGTVIPTFLYRTTSND